MTAIDFPSAPTTGQLFRTPIVRDSFNRANSTTTMGSTDTGQTWVPNSGTWGITSNAAYRVGTTGQATTVVESGLSDCIVEATMSTFSATPDAGLCFRSTDDNNNYVLNATTLFRRQGGTYTAIGPIGTVVQGDVVRVELKGSLIKVFVNNVLRLGVTDTHNMGATKHGLRVNGGTVAFDNFSIYDIESNIWIYNGTAWVLDYTDPVMRAISLNTKTNWKSVTDSAASSNGWQSLSQDGDVFNVSFTKLFSSSLSSVVVTMNMSSYHSATGQAKFGVYGLDGTSVTQIIHGFHNTASTHQGFSATQEITGKPAGTYTIEVYWYTNSGTLSCDTNDSQSITVREKLLAPV